MMLHATPARSITLPSGFAKPTFRMPLGAWILLASAASSLPPPSPRIFNPRAGIWTIGGGGIRRGRVEGGAAVEDYWDPRFGE
eukprot:1325053-Amorphochlora_amoeboformis.AAC.1